MPEEEKNALQAQMLSNRLRKRDRHLRKWARRTGIDAYRLYDRDIPEIPLTLDRYGDALAGALYERPYEKDTRRESLWLALIKEAISETLGIPPDSIFLKERKRQRGKAQYEKQRSENFTRNIHEGDISFTVNLSDYLDSGLFLDRRKLRTLIRSEAEGKSVLNLFCYTASLSVAAAKGRALLVDSVDMSNTYLNWAARNFTLNGLRTFSLSPERLAGGPAWQKRLSEARASAFPPCPLIRADALRFINGAVEAGLSWDMLILDPPSFSNSKKMQETFDLKRDYWKLVSQCLKLLTPGGTLYFSVNTGNFHIDTDAFPHTLIEDIRDRLIDEDFKGKKTPACYTIRRREW
ncbi:MAG: class I SAM-dependent methyltransferase [Treponema sp.]|jgi:23S rRNA G2069 N7-methylase RlmK/C1962 C5-methylase RlmI|nr:class I SAM-dependent methyltransferase [Treponema sp.]